MLRHVPCAARPGFGRALPRLRLPLFLALQLRACRLSARLPPSRTLYHVPTLAHDKEGPELARSLFFPSLPTSSCCLGKLKRVSYSSTCRRIDRLIPNEQVVLLFSCTFQKVRAYCLGIRKGSSSLTPASVSPTYCQRSSTTVFPCLTQARSCYSNVWKHTFKQEPT